MRDYAAAYAAFSLEALSRSVLSGPLDGPINPCIECCDRWAAEGRRALHWMGADGAERHVSYAELQDGAARFANLLTARGIGPGDVVAGMLPRIPELLIAVLGTWRAGAVFQPLFTAFGPAAIESRTVDAPEKRTP